MPRNRAPKPGAKYYLPRYEYYTIVNFCLTYPTVKAELAALDGYRSRALDGMPHAQSQESTTEQDAIRRAGLQSKVDLIEGAVLKCTEGDGLYNLYPGMLAAITTDGMTLERLREKYAMPTGLRQFSTLRRKIYYTIAQELF